MEKKSNLGNTALKVFAIADFTAFYLHVVCVVLYKAVAPLNKLISKAAKNSAFVEAIESKYLDFNEYNMIYFLITLFIGIVGCIILAVICEDDKKRCIGALLLMPAFYAVMYGFAAALDFSARRFGTNIPEYLLITLFVAVLACMYIFFVDSALKSEETPASGKRVSNMKKYNVFANISLGITALYCILNLIAVVEAKHPLRGVI